MRSSLLPIHVLPLSPILESLEDLGVFFEDAIFYVKPFRDWVGVPAWVNSIFGMRICNAGDVMEVLQQASSYSEIAKDKAIAINVLSLSISSINKISVTDPIKLEEFNKTVDARLTHQQYLQLYLQNLEEIVIERLNYVYGGLQLKQQRMLKGISVCDCCGKEYNNPLPEGCKFPLYTLTEIICAECCNVTPEVLTKYDFAIDNNFSKNVVANTVESNTETQPVVSFTTNITEELSDPYKCQTCEESFADFEAFQAHRQDKNH